MVPVWNGLSNGIVGGAQNVVSNASYLNNIENYAYYLNLLFGLFFIGMGIGIWAYLLLQAWRAEAVSYSLPGEEVE
jgi:membrane protein required for beta-lactamase induction